MSAYNLTATEQQITEHNKEKLEKKFGKGKTKYNARRKVSGKSQKEKTWWEFRYGKHRPF